jgi:hypothetical protein
MAGTLCGPLFLCLKEPDGHMSDNVKKNLFKADNIVLTCKFSTKKSNLLPIRFSLIFLWILYTFYPISVTRRMSMNLNGDTVLFFMNISGSKSGKLTTSLVQYWMDKVLLPTVGQKKFILIND